MTSASAVSSRGRTIGWPPRSVTLFTSSTINGWASAGPSTSTRSPGWTSTEYRHRSSDSVVRRGSGTGANTTDSPRAGPVTGREHGVEQPAGAEPHRVVRDQARGGLGLVDRGARRALGQAGRLQRHADHGRRADVPGEPLVVGDQLRDGRYRVARVALDQVTPRLVHEPDR